MRLPLTVEPPRQVGSRFLTPVMDADGVWILFGSESLSSAGVVDWLDHPEVALIRAANESHAKSLALADIHTLVDGLKYGDDPVEVAESVQRIVARARGD
jgi:hypothetical protein